MDNNSVKPAEIDPSLTIPNALPDGYHAGLLTAMTVFLGFSLSFLRFWGLEVPGNWTPRGVIAAVVVMIGIIVQLYALFRALHLNDKAPQHYSVTRWWFLGGVVIVVGGVVGSIVISAFT